MARPTTSGERGLNHVQEIFAEKGHGMAPIPDMFLAARVPGAFAPSADSPHCNEDASLAARVLWAVRRRWIRCQLSFRIVIPPYSSVPVSKDEETNTKSVVAPTEIQILARNSLCFAPGAAN